MSSTLIVEVCKIENIIPHPNGDFLEKVIIKGWECIVKKDDYEAGDTVVFVPPDSLLPIELADRLGVRNYLVGKDMNRVKCTRLRGEMSFGLIIDNEEDWDVGTDVREHYGIEKYEPPLRTVAGDAAPDDLLFPKFTDIENIRNYPNLFQEGEQVVITEKIDGTNCRIGFSKNEEDGVVTIEWKAGSHKVKRKRPPCEEITKNTYWFPSSLGSVKSLLVALSKDNNAYGCKKSAVLFGEVYGRVRGGHKSMHYGKQNSLNFAAFALQIDGKYVNWTVFQCLCDYFDVPMVPEIYSGTFMFDAVKELSRGKSILAAQNDADHMREGIVVCSLIERTDIRTGRVVLKLHNDDYLIMKDKKAAKGEDVDFKDE